MAVNVEDIQTRTDVEWFVINCFRKRLNILYLREKKKRIRVARRIFQFWFDSLLLDRNVMDTARKGTLYKDKHLSRT